MPIFRVHAALALGTAITCTSILGCSTMRQDVVAGDGFRHATAALDRQRAAHDAEATLHIYIDGDGKPFVTPLQVANDPSPVRPFVFRLQHEDANDSLFIGRPCYHGMIGDPACGPLVWTNERYSSAVVASMVAAARTLSEGRGLVLIGYSGGGTIAMLMAPHLPNLIGVITVAANLDTAAWASHHGYTRLEGSLNPVKHAAGSAHIPQRHYFGGDDTVIPQSVVARARTTMPPGSVVLLDGFDHTCCWAKAWPELLRDAQDAFAAPTRRARTEAPR